ncbi:MAG: CYTH and CHAD domain-containing protein [Arthrobacter sp.]|uniref:CYTH and CHAD domain-containing protein n=1 Tax=Arthrobacter sp. TaxID=1667 RepID=UPI0034947945
MATAPTSASGSPGDVSPAPRSAPAGRAGPAVRYGVWPATPAPPLRDLPGVHALGEGVRWHLESVYWDTATLALAARRATLCRRRGGAGPEWWLDLPGGVDGPQRLLAGPGRAGVVPGVLMDRLLVLTRGEPLVPVARLARRRTTVPLFGPSGEHLGDFVDDSVESEAAAPAASRTSWREWSIRSAPGAPDLGPAADAVLRDAGATRAADQPEVARALGPSWPAARVARPPKGRRRGPAFEVLAGYLSAQVGDLVAVDPEVRRGEPDAVHRMRSATRRLRSALSTYGPFLGEADTAAIRGELKWLAEALGRARDAEVTRARILGHGELLAEDERRGLGWIGRELDAAHDAGYRSVLDALSSARYFRLLGDLEDLRDHPAPSREGLRPARKATVRLVDRAARRLERSREAADSLSGPGREAALHRVRKDAKRLRHAVEAVVGIHGARVRDLGQSAQRVQAVLGDHQDGVVARDVLTRLARDPGLPPSASRACHRLLELEVGLSRESDSAYRGLSRDGGRPGTRR